MQNEYSRSYWPSELDIKTEFITYDDAANDAPNHFEFWNDFFESKSIEIQNFNHNHDEPDDNSEKNEYNNKLAEDEVANFELYKKNNDRIELLIRKFNSSQYVQQSKEENTRLEMLEKQVELLNPRYSTQDYEGLVVLGNLAKSLEKFHESD